MIKTEATAVGAALELLAPRFPDLCATSSGLRVRLALSESLDVQLSFPDLSVVKEVECINFEEGCPRCKFQGLLRGLAVLQQHDDVDISGIYVVNGERNYSTLQLQVQVRDAAKVDEFEFVQCHLEPMADSGETARAKRLNARQSSCHVVGCRLHRWKRARTRVSLAPTLKQEFVKDEEEATKQESSVTIEAPTRSAPSSLEHQEQVVRTQTRRFNLPNLFHSLMARTEDDSMCMWGEHVPNLELTLYEHQRRGISWMLQREQPELWDTVLPHPFSAPGVELDIELEREFNEAAHDVCGGMLCDEPGLGKTITMLAIVLLSKGETTANMPARVNAPSGNSSTRRLRSSGARDRSLRADDLVSSAATLIVAPDALVDHWAEQIEAHVAPDVLKVFVDEDEDLPSSSKLAKYDVVITSFSRMTKEWKLHRPPSTLEERQTQRYGFEDQPQRYLDGNVRGAVSSLLLVHWLRVVVDEGHKLGGRAPTHLMLMARLLCAERRWVMTGTPSPNTLQSADLQYLHGLLVFLRNQPYGRPDGLVWNKAIGIPFVRNEVVGYLRLQHLLRRIMIRHTKESIRDKLPHPVRHTAIIAPTPSEYKLYNGIAASVRANLVLAIIDPDTPGNAHPDSLLNPKNRKAAMKVETNLVLASTGGFYGEWTVDVTEQGSVVQRLRASGVGESRVSSVVSYLDSVRPRATTQCRSCKSQRTNMMVLPCGHLCCASCVQGLQDEGSYCAFCDEPFDEDDLSYLQPTITGELTARGRNNTIEKLRMHGVRDKRIRRVNAYLDTLAPKLPTECRTCKRYLFLLLILPCGHLSCADCVEKRYLHVGPSCGVCKTMYDRDAFIRLQPGIFFRAPEEDKPGRTKKTAGLKNKKRKKQSKRVANYKRDYWQVDSSKIFYIATRIRELREEFARSRSRGGPRTVKAIVFSQFRECIWRTRVALKQQDIVTADFIALISAKERIEYLAEFRSDPDVNVLLLSNLGSHGLDLSFVTHIFLLEEIYDKSVEQQVISRAHRMGANQSVVVEQLWMKGSVECESMQGVSQDEFEGTTSTESRQQQPTRGEVQEASSADKSSFQQVRVNFVLSNLRVLGEDVVAKDGEVCFSVQDEVTAIIRQGVHVISEEGGVTTVSTMPVPPPPQLEPPAALPSAHDSPEIIEINDSSPSDIEYDYGSDAIESDEEDKRARMSGLRDNTCGVKVEDASSRLSSTHEKQVYIEISGEETESE